MRCRRNQADEHVYKHVIEKLVNQTNHITSRITRVTEHGQQ